MASAGTTELNLVLWKMTNIQIMVTIFSAPTVFLYFLIAANVVPAAYYVATLVIWVAMLGSGAVLLVNYRSVRRGATNSSSKTSRDKELQNGGSTFTSPATGAKNGASSMIQPSSTAD